MLLELFSGFITAWILLVSGITASLSLFRVPLRQYAITILLIGFVMESISFYTIYFWKNYAINDYELILMIIAEIFLISRLFKLPYLYSILICIFGFLGSIPVLIGVTLILTVLGISNDEIIHSNNIHLYLFRCTCSLILLLIAYLLHYKKIGFMLKPNQFQMKNLNKGFYLILFLIVWIGVFIVLFTIVYTKYSFVLFLSYCFIFIIGVIVAYRLNIKHIRDKYSSR